MGLDNFKIVKMVAAGNDFIIFKEGENTLSKDEIIALCDRHYGVGGDGVLFVGPDSMRIFNSDGSEAEMCGNGARCAMRFIYENFGREKAVMNTLAGPIRGWYFPGKKSAKVELTSPKNVRCDFSLSLKSGRMDVGFADTGVPHTIVFVEDVDSVDVDSLGREIRYHEDFAPAGTNVDFVQIVSDCEILARTYERGVEAETLACGTGSVASALLSLIKRGITKGVVNVKARSGEILTVEIEKSNSGFRTTLEGPVKHVFDGEIFD